MIVRKRLNASSMRTNRSCFSVTDCLSNVLAKSAMICECEAETDVASADAPPVIYVVGPWPPTKRVPNGLPRGGKAAPFTERCKARGEATRKAHGLRI